MRFAPLLRTRVAVPCHYGCFADRTNDPDVFATLVRGSRGDMPPVVIPYAELYRYCSPGR